MSGPTGMACVVLLAGAVLGGCVAQRAAAQPETYSWKRVAIGGGGFITGYSSDDAGVTRVARTDVHGAYLWHAERDRWVQLVSSATMPEKFHVQDGFNEGVYEAVVAPSRRDRIYMAVKGRVFWSDDRGRRFSASEAGLPTPLNLHPNGEFRGYGPFLAVSPDNPDLVLFGTPENGLFRSEDGGKSWARVETVPPAARLRHRDVEPSPGLPIWFERGRQNSASRVWVMSAGHGMLLSQDAGRSFLPLPISGGPRPTVISQGAFTSDGTFYGVDPEQGRVWRFRDQRWTDLVGSKAIPTATFVSVAADPHRDRILVFDQGGVAYRSSDGGASWVRLFHRSRPGERDPPWLRVSNQSYFAMGPVLFDPKRPDRIWAGTGTGVYYADLPDWLPTVTWISQTRGIEELVANDVVQASGQPPLFAVLDFGVHRKVDLQSYSTTYGPKERVLIAVQQLALTPADPSFVATNASDTRTGCCWQDGDAVLAGFSTDGGRTWTKFPSLPTPQGTSSSDPWRMSFGTIAVSAGSPDNIVWEPSFHRAPFYTRDRGRTWQPIRLDGRPTVRGSHGQRFLQRKTLTADGRDAGTFYLAYGAGSGDAKLAGLWRTVDQGATWQQAYKGEIAPGSDHAAKLRAVPGRAGDLFFTSAVSGESDTRLRRSSDGGATWTPIRTMDRVDDIAFGKPFRDPGPPTIFVSGRLSGRYGIWRSIDDAATWTRVGRFPLGSLDQVTVLGADPNQFGRVYIGYLGSGFVVGEPAPCRPGPYAFADPDECTAVEAGE
ncbi:WD40/YVTN/BNR-like repeat-containing protein [Methylobacterium tarhaniae]|nr:sialidase family protein [Methylobacterium tarhaniae]